MHTGHNAIIVLKVKIKAKLTSLVIIMLLPIPNARRMSFMKLCAAFNAIIERLYLVNHIAVICCYDLPFFDYKSM